MLWTVAAESTHNHPTRTSEVSCTICVAAHSTSPTVKSNSARPVFSQIGLAAEEDVLAHVRLNAHDLGIRGPPVS
jgi:hypothetical protein